MRNSRPDQVEDEGRQTFEELDRDVAQDRVADDHVGHVVNEVLALDVAREIEVGPVEELGRLLDPGVALALLLADREERHPRVRDAQHPLGEEGAHVGVLVEVLGGRIGIGADVEEHERPGFGDHLDGQGRSIDAAQAAQPQDRGGHAGAGMAGRDDGFRLAALDEIHGHEDRRILLLAERASGMLIHADDLARGCEAHVGRRVGPGEASSTGRRRRRG